MTIRAPKDFWTGVMFIALAAVAIATARGYTFGVAGHMGPGYFPTLLGYALLLIGGILIVRSLLIDGEPVGQIKLLPLVIVIVAVCLFGFSIETLGLVAAMVIVTFLSAMANREVRLIEAGLLAAGLAVLAVLIFILALRLPLPAWPTL